MDVLAILAWTQQPFGEATRLRYESLIVAALRDVARQPDRPGSLARPEFGAGALFWRLRLGREDAKPGVGIVRRPRHFLVYRLEPGLVVVGRLLHDAMELARHLNLETACEEKPAPGASEG